MRSLDQEVDGKGVGVGSFQVNTWGAGDTIHWVVRHFIQVKTKRIFIRFCTSSKFVYVAVTTDLAGGCHARPPTGAHGPRLSPSRGKESRVPRPPNCSTAWCIQPARDFQLEKCIICNSMIHSKPEGCIQRASLQQRHPTSTVWIPLLLLLCITIIILVILALWLNDLCSVCYCTADLTPRLATTPTGKCLFTPSEIPLLLSTFMSLCAI